MRAYELNHPLENQGYGKKTWLKKLPSNVLPEVNKPNTRDF